MANDTLEEKRKKLKQEILKNHIAEQSLQDNDFSVKPDISQLEAGLRGTAQGATLGFADELSGALSAAGSKLTGDDAELSDLYTKARDESRARYKLAEEQHPGTYLTGNIVGGIAPAALTGGIGAGIQGAARLGGIAGLGASNVDLVKDDKTVAEKVDEAGKDILLGQALGAGIAYIPAGMKSLGGAIAKTAPGKSFLRGYKGEKIDSGTFAETLGQKTADYSKKTLDKIQQLEQGLAKLKGTLVKENKTPIDPSKARSVIEEGLQDVAPSGSNVASLKQIQEEALEDVSQAFGDKEIKTLQKVQKTGVSTDSIPESSSARAKLEQEIAKEKVAADALGQNIRHEIKESIGPDGKKYLTKITSSDEPIEGAERVISVEDAFGNKEQKLIKPDTQYKTTVKAKVVEDDPEEIKTIISKVRNNESITPYEAEQLSTVLESLKGKSSYKDIGPITTSLGKGQAELRKAINEIPEFAKLNEELQTVNAARRSIGAESDFGANPIDFKGGDPKQYKLHQAIYKAANERGSGAQTRDQLKSLIDNITKIDPELGQNLQKNIPSFIEDAKLAQIFNPDPNYSRAGLIKQLLTKGSNPAGRVIGYGGRPAEKVLSSTGLDTVISKGTEQAGITATTRGDVNTGDIEKADTSKLSTRFSQMSPEQMLDIANRLRATGSEGIAKQVEKAAESGKSIDKAQAQLVIQQNPEAKKILRAEDGR